MITQISQHDIKISDSNKIIQVDKKIFLCWGNNFGRLRNVRKVIGTILPKYNARAADSIMIDV